VKRGKEKGGGKVSGEAKGWGILLDRRGGEKGLYRWGRIWKKRVHGKKENLDQSFRNIFFRLE